jgi:hypothetical protein
MQLFIHLRACVRSLFWIVDTPTRKCKRLYTLTMVRGPRASLCSNKSSDYNNVHILRLGSTRTNQRLDFASAERPRNNTSSKLTASPFGFTTTSAPSIISSDCTPTHGDYLNCTAMLVRWLRGGRTQCTTREYHGVSNTSPPGA